MYVFVYMYIQTYIYVSLSLSRSLSLSLSLYIYIYIQHIHEDGCRAVSLPAPQDPGMRRRRFSSCEITDDNNTVNNGDHDNDNLNRNNGYLPNYNYLKV